MKADADGLWEGQPHASNAKGKDKSQEGAQAPTINESTVLRALGHNESTHMTASYSPCEWFWLC